MERWRVVHVPCSCRRDDRACASIRENVDSVTEGHGRVIAQKRAIPGDDANNWLTISISIEIERWSSIRNYDGVNRSTILPFDYGWVTIDPHWEIAGDNIFSLGCARWRSVSSSSSLSSVIPMRCRELLDSQWTLEYSFQFVEYQWHRTVSSRSAMAFDTSATHEHQSSTAHRSTRRSATCEHQFVQCIDFIQYLARLQRMEADSSRRPANLRSIDLYKTNRSSATRKGAIEPSTVETIEYHLLGQSCEFLSGSTVERYRVSRMSLRNHRFSISNDGVQWLAFIRKYSNGRWYSQVNTRRTCA